MTVLSINIPQKSPVCEIKKATVETMYLETIRIRY